MKNGKTLISGLASAILLFSLTVVYAQRSTNRRSRPTTSQDTPRLVIQASGPSTPLAVAYSSDGEYALSGGTDRLVKLWHLETGRELQTFGGHRGMISSVAFSPDNRLALSGSNDKTIKLWDIASGKEILTFRGGENEIASVAFSPDGKYVLSADHTDGRNRLQFTDGYSGSVILWNASTARKIRSFTAPENRTLSPYAVAFSHDGKYVASGGDDGDVRVWETLTGRSVYIFKNNGRVDVNSVAFSPDDRLLLVGGNQQTLTLWNLKEEAEVWSKPPQANEPAIESVAFSPNGNYIAAGGMTLKDGWNAALLKLWETASGKELKTFVGHQGRVNSLAYSADGATLLSASDDQAIKLWNVSTTTEIRSIEGYAKEISAVAVSKDGRYLLTGSGSWYSLLIRYAAINEAEPSETASKAEFFKQFQEQTLTLWDLAVGGVVRTMHGHKLGISALDISPDGKYAVSGGIDGAVIVWDLATGKEVQRLQDRDETSDSISAIRTVSYSPDGRYIASLQEKKYTIILWNVLSGKQERSFTTDWLGDSGSAPMFFSPDGHSLIFANDDDLTITNISTGQQRKIRGLEGGIDSIAFSSDGRYAFGGNEDYIQVVELETGKEIKEISDFPENTAHVKFSPDGRHVLLSRRNRPSEIWDIQTGKPTQSLTGSQILIRAETFSPDGRYVFSGSEDGTTRIWEVKDEPFARTAESSDSFRGLGTLASFKDGSWAVVDPNGRYNVSHSGEANGIHWIYKNEPITLSQLKERYYDPQLLPKLTGYNKQVLRDVRPFRNVELSPLVEYKAPPANSTKLNIQLTDRGGGIGTVSVLVNNKEVIRNVNPQFGTRSGKAQLVVDLSGAHIKPGEVNKIQVKAANAGNYLVSRVFERDWIPSGVAVRRDPELYAIIAGTSTYASPALNLKFAAKDAEDMAKAIELGAKRFLGDNKVHITLLGTSTNPKALPPTKANFIKAFEEARNSHPEDILVVYLSGHALVFNEGDESKYAYLTADATGTDLSDKQVRGQRAITSEELISWIKLIPALKQVMILDTCAAEAAFKTLVDRRMVPDKQIIAMERLADRTGFHVLMGSAADAVSYEASKYRQGLLTYSLLLGMRGAALRQDEYVDVSKLFQFAADEVPQLALNIGGIQKPHIAALRATSFDIGRLIAEDKAAIPQAAVHPIILSPRLINSVSYFDDLKLTQSLIKKLVEDSYISKTEAMSASETVFIDVREMAGALLPSGTYVINGETVNVSLVLVKDEKPVARIEVSGSKSALNELIDKLAQNITQEAKKLCCD